MIVVSKLPILQTDKYLRNQNTARHFYVSQWIEDKYYVPGQEIGCFLLGGRFYKPTEETVDVWLFTGSTDCRVTLFRNRDEVYFLEPHNLEPEELEKLLEIFTSIRKKFWRLK